VGRASTKYPVGNPTCILQMIYGLSFEDAEDKDERRLRIKWTID